MLSALNTIKEENTNNKWHSLTNNILKVYLKTI